MTGFLTGPEGENSSKRLAGLILVGSGAIVFGLGIILADPTKFEFVKYVGTTLIASGAGLLGFGTLAERIGK